MRSLLLAFLVLPPAGWAQENCLDHIRFPEVGRWAEYRAVYNQDPYTVRYAVVGAETRQGKEFQWIEMRMAGGKKNETMIYQMLVPGGLADMDQVEEIVFKPGDQPAMKMSGMMLGMIRKQLDKQSFLREACEGVSLVGKENVTVPAGRFTALHYRSSDQGIDSWLSPELPFALVKSSGKDHQVELTGQGDGAKSSITETPREMGGMGGPPAPR